MLNNENKMPLYFQLVKILKKQIKDEMKPDDKILSEKEICDMYSVSRTTVRLAMAELEKNGYIYRIQGKGSFVADLKEIDDNYYSEVEDIKLIEKLYNDSYEYISITSGVTSYCPCTIEKFNKEVKNKFIQYLVIVEEKKSFLLDYYIYDKSITMLDDMYFEKYDIDDLLNKISIKEIEESYTIELASRELSEKLDVRLNTPLMCVETNILNKNNKIILTCIKHIVTERYRYKNITKSI